jgi:methyl-accepting chemotaxis protein
MLNGLSSAMRVRLALGLMSLLVVAVAFSGRIGLRHVEDTTQEILLGDVHLAEVARDTRSYTLQLRRYEKDYFLNMGAPKTQADYLAKWKAAFEKVLGYLDELDSLVSSQADHEVLRGMREDLAIYASGFDKVGTAVRSGEIPTPQAANLAITGYKDAIHGFEAMADALGGQSDFRMSERLKLLKTDGRRTDLEMSATAALAVMVAVFLAFRLARAVAAQGDPGKPLTAEGRSNERSPAERRHPAV